MSCPAAAFDSRPTRTSAILRDDTFARLLTFPNVLITGHQAFLTQEALRNIAATTPDNIDAFASGAPRPYEVACG